ncbi:hypothetical protein MAC_03380 [Metarhizium acridum CQMa 102]|uniref:Uncharacterized protein n=1 Tax=Metarhizium acridum (strain CQMa 102) TaxID=655827 RepID=E9E0I2_METAQ|nr:uncharacterized protein MAC_03380 [Metarhizium acridum CQMa 102]EFY90602.1 hypothetical protein MAC_03380 [Metarhizium acridum CQMa 102]
MVSTRRSAATQAAHDSIYDFESPDKSKELQTRRQGVARKAAPNITTRRGWEETEPDAPVVKRRTLKKPGRRQTSKAVVEDEHEDDVPQDPNFYKNINDSAAGKTKARRATMAVREDDAAAEEQLLQESQQREGHVLAEEEEQNDPWSYRDSAEPSNDDDESHESHREVDGEKDVDVAGEGEDQGEETEESDGEDGSSDDDVREVTGSAVAPGSASQINNLENIASIDVISTDIVYIEPEPPDRSASTFYLNCDGLNTMINAMGKRGWMSTPGEWTDQLLRIEEESRTESEATKADNCTKLFHEILALWRNCKEMPKAPLLNLQAQFLPPCRNTHTACRAGRAVKTLAGGAGRKGQDHQGEEGRTDDAVCGFYAADAGGHAEATGRILRQARLATMGRRGAARGDSQDEVSESGVAGQASTRQIVTRGYEQSGRVEGTDQGKI